MKMATIFNCQKANSELDKDFTWKDYYNRDRGTI